MLVRLPALIIICSSRILTIIPLVLRRGTRGIPGDEVGDGAGERAVGRGMGECVRGREKGGVRGRRKVLGEGKGGC